MRHGKTINVIIPALNEERSIARVIEAIPPWVDKILVADNGSTDTTAAVAEGAGAQVIPALRPGYGSACQAAIAALGHPDIVVFLDADLSDFPQQMDRLVDPIASDEADLVIGSRVLGRCEPGALTPQQRWGNWLATRLIRLFWGVLFTDLGPFRAIGYDALKRLAMCDPDFGWTVEMQIKAARWGLRAIEAPVDYRRRIGVSKISGTVRGVVLAGTKILGTIFLSLLPGQARRRRLIIFTRYPEPGKTKTRLIPALGADGAARLHRRMAEYTTGWVRELARGHEMAAEVRHAGAWGRSMRRWLGRGFEYRDQGDGDLGQRLKRSFAEGFGRGASRVVTVGTDCPWLTARHGAKAFDALADHDVVLGPAQDGGYTLIGLSRPAPALLEGIPWGTGGVLEMTLEKAQALGLTVALLETLADVDRPEDLAALKTHASITVPNPTPTISVIIPTLNEAATVEQAIASTQDEGVAEVIVADGGSTDETRAIARQAGAHVIESPAGRARQMNAGAFGLTIDNPRPVFRFMDAVVELRSTLLGRPYGDQAFFLYADRLRQIRGFADLPIMEDYELIERLRRHGRVEISPLRAVTSARRWERLGILKTTLINLRIIVGYRLGVEPARLRKWYDR